MLWRHERRGATAVLRFNNPPRNFLTFQAFADLQHSLESIADDPSVKLVMLASGVPGYFAAHADLDELAQIQDGPVAEARSWYTALRTIENIPQPVVALLDGQVWGGGLELALACDLRIALPGTHLRMPEIDLGFIPGAGGTQRLLRLLGSGHAADLVMTGRVALAEEAARLGLVKLIDDERQAEAYVDLLGAKSGAALAAAKRVLRAGADLALKDALRLEGQEFGALLPTPAARELVTDARARYANATADVHVHV